MEKYHIVTYGCPITVHESEKIAGILSRMQYEETQDMNEADIIVFNTEGLMVGGQKLTDIGGYYYIKRLAALSGDTVKIADNQLWVRPRGQSEFRRIQDIEPRFKKIYSHFY